MTKRTISYDDGLYFSYFSNVRLSESESDTGLAAARAVFAQHGVTARDCYRAAHLAGEDRPFDPRLRRIWYLAEHMSLEAATAGWVDTDVPILLECDGAEVGQ